MVTIHCRMLYKPEVAGLPKIHQTLGEDCVPLCRKGYFRLQLKGLVFLIFFRIFLSNLRKMI